MFEHPEISAENLTHKNQTDLLLVTKFSKLTTVLDTGYRFRPGIRSGPQHWGRLQRPMPLAGTHGEGGRRSLPQEPQPASALLAWALWASLRRPPRPPKINPSASYGLDARPI